MALLILSPNFRYILGPQRLAPETDLEENEGAARWRRYTTNIGWRSDDMYDGWLAYGALPTVVDMTSSAWRVCAVL